jgi:hypothetical protein
MSEQLALQTELAERQLAIAERQAEMSEAQFNFYKENFLPSLEELLSQAERGLDVDYAATIAGQMSRASTDAAKVSQTNELSRLGVDRSADVYAGLDSNIEDAAKTAEADARNMARRGAVDTNQQMQLQVAGMASGVPITAQSALNQSAGSLAGAAATAANASAGVNSVMQSQANANQQAALTANQAAYSNAQFQADASFANQMAQAQAMNQMYSAAGSLAGAGVTYAATRTPSTPGTPGTNASSYDAGNYLTPRPNAPTSGSSMAPLMYA